jgi:hypothetical protein
MLHTVKTSQLLVILMMLTASLIFFPPVSFEKLLKSTNMRKLFSDGQGNSFGSGRLVLDG